VFTPSPASHKRPAQKGQGLSAKRPWTDQQQPFTATGGGFKGKSRNRFKNRGKSKPSNNSGNSIQGESRSRRFSVPPFANSWPFADSRTFAGSRTFAESRRPLIAVCGELGVDFDGPLDSSDYLHRTENSSSQVPQAANYSSLDSCAFRSSEGQSTGTGGGLTSPQGCMLPCGPGVPTTTSGILNLLLSPKEDRRLAPHLESETVQQDCSTADFQDGLPGSHQGGVAPRFVGHVYRSDRCVPPHPCRPEGPSLPTLCLPRQGLRLVLPSIRSFRGSQGLHHGSQGGGCLPSQSRGYRTLPISGRLADSRREPRTGTQPHFYDSVPSREAGLASQLLQVSPCPDSDHRSLGLETGFRSFNGVPLSREDLQSGESRSSAVDNICHYGGGLAEALGSHEQHDGPSSFLQVPLAPPPLPSPSVLGSSGAPGDSSHPSTSHHSSIHSVVVGQSKHHGRCPLSSSTLHPRSFHRRLTSRVGWSVRGRKGLGGVGLSPPLLPHQQVGAAGSLLGSQTLREAADGVQSSREIGQHHYGGLHQSRGRNTIHTSRLSSKGATRLDSEQGHPDSGRSYSGLRQRLRGRSLEGRCLSDGMDSGPSSLPPDQLPVALPPDRSVCVEAQSPDSDLLLLESGSPRIRTRRVQHPLDELPGVCLPSFQPPPEDPLQVGEGGGGDDSGGPPLAQTDLVLHGSTPSSGAPSSPTSQGGPPPQPSDRIDTVITRVVTPQPDCMAIVKQSLQTRGFSQQVATLVAKSRRASTRGVYDSRLSHFFKWCNDKDINPCSASEQHICEFLADMFSSSTVAVRSLKQYRSAIASIHQGFEDGSSVTSSTTVSALFKGMFHERPPIQRVPPSWNLTVVLQLFTLPPFDSLGTVELKLLAGKTAFLLAAVTAKRRSELQAIFIDPSHMAFGATGVTLSFAPGFLAKNQTEVFTPEPLFIPRIRSLSSEPRDRLWCPVETLKAYIDRTREIRPDGCNRLFISLKKPHKAVSRDTLSRWIVDTIKLAYQRRSLDPPVGVRAHDTRAVASSWAAFAGVPMHIIMRTASWRSQTTFTSCYLKDMLGQDAALAKAVLDRRPSL
jgi:hypothetical protein